MAQATIIKPKEESKNPEKPKRSRSNAALAVREDVSVVAGIQLSSKELERALKAQTEQRKLIKDFIQSHLVKGVDYLRIHVVRSCYAEQKQRGSCNEARHFSKDILAKPGQEKIFSLFQLTSKLEKDIETMEMLPGRSNLVAYKCFVLRGDKIVAEGRGAAEVGDKGRDVNSTIKIAEKRARMDACLALGFSEYFAQDLDDPDYQAQRKAAEEQAAAEANDQTGLPVRPETAPVDADERQLLYRHMLRCGFKSNEQQLALLESEGIADSSNATSGQFRSLILKLKDGLIASPPVEPVVKEPELDVDKEMTAALSKLDEPAGEESKPAPVEAPPLVVDAELKEEVQKRAESLGINYNGQMWLFKSITGRPFGKWEKFTDNEWRRAYDVVTGILEGVIEVPDRYVAGLIEDEAEPKAEEASGDQD